MNFNNFFPTVIGNSVYHNHDNLVENLVNHCFEIKKNVKSGGQGWLSNNTYNTSNGQYDIVMDSLFAPLNSWVRQQVEKYCENLGLDKTSLKNNGSWFNIYQKYDFQETHVHPTSAVSAIYILACSKDGARVFFNSPLNSMYYVKKDQQKQEMTDQVICNSIPGTLLVFPSYLPHAVERHGSELPRISLSYNYTHG